MRTRHLAVVLTIALASIGPATAIDQPQPGLRIALMKQPFVPNGTSTGPATMANGGIQEALKALASHT